MEEEAEELWEELGSFPMKSYFSVPLTSLSITFHDPSTHSASLKLNRGKMGGLSHLCGPLVGFVS